MNGVFVSGTGTGVGKTFVGVFLVRALREQGYRAIALKPCETGCDPHPADAILLADASGDKGLASAPGFHRGRAPLAPYAALLEGEPAPPTPAELAESVRRELTRAEAEWVIVEGAGGILSPLDASNTNADLALALGWPAVLVALDSLGTISHTLTAYQSAIALGVNVRCIVLNRPPAIAEDPSSRTNARIIGARCDCPVVSVAGTGWPQTVLSTVFS